MLFIIAIIKIRVISRYMEGKIRSERSRLTMLAHNVNLIVNLNYPESFYKFQIISIFSMISLCIGKGTFTCTVNL